MMIKYALNKIKMCSQRGLSTKLTLIYLCASWRWVVFTPEEHSFPPWVSWNSRAKGRVWSQLWACRRQSLSPLSGPPVTWEGGRERGRGLPMSASLFLQRLSLGAFWGSVWLDFFQRLAGSSWQQCAFSMKENIDLSEAGESPGVQVPRPTLNSEPPGGRLGVCIFNTLPCSWPGFVIQSRFCGLGSLALWIILILDANCAREEMRLDYMISKSSQVYSILMKTSIKYNLLWYCLILGFFLFCFSLKNLDF